MQMTNAELAEFLNARCGLAGQDAVTANVVRQWVEWDVLPKATAQGRAIGQRPTWSRSGAALHRAARLGELRKRGIRGEKPLIVHAYIEWGHPDFDRVRTALKCEWVKWASQLTRRQTTFLGKSEFQNVSVTKKRAIAAQIGPLDDLFRGTQFEQSPEIYAAFSEFSRTGEGNSDYLTALMGNAFQQFSPSIAQTIPANCISIVTNSISGMTGKPDEIGNSAESFIQNSSERQFRVARHQIRLFLRELRKISQHRQSTAPHFGDEQLWKTLDSLALQISTGPWLVFSYIQALKSTPPQVEKMR